MQHLLLSLLFFGFVAAAEIPKDVKTEIDLRVKHDLNPSIVVGLYENGQSYFYTHGLINKNQSQAVDNNSVYEIGSVTKTFTSLLLATLVNDKKIKLDDAIQDYWPKPFILEDPEKQPITFKQLATHTSGLPRLPNNLMLFSQDPYANYDRSLLIKAINTTKPKNAGSQYAYSNFAVGLLGETLALIENQPFNALIEQNIIKPLALNHTYMQLNQVPPELLVQGYAGKKAATAWNFKALAAAGSIRSSIKDLLNYGVAHLNLSENNLSTAMQMVTTKQYQQGGLKVGLGWHINSDGIIWHNGGTAGFSSIIMLDPTQQKVVVGITNSSPSNSIEDIAAHLMNPSKPMVDHEFPVPIESDQLDQFTGTFNHLATEKNITIIKHQDRLFFTALKQPRQAMTFIGDDTFKISTFKVKLKFQRNTNDQITAMDLNGWGKPQSYKKTINP